MKRAKEYLLGFGVLIVLASAYFGYRQLFGTAVGETCTDSSECAGNLPWGGNSCLNDSGIYYCTKTCENDADCREGWQCGEVSGTYNGMRTSQVDNYCVKLQ